MLIGRNSQCTNEGEEWQYTAIKTCKVIYLIERSRHLSGPVWVGMAKVWGCSTQNSVSVQYSKYSTKSAKCLE